MGVKLNNGKWLSAQGNALSSGRAVPCCMHTCDQLSQSFVCDKKDCRCKEPRRVQNDTLAPDAKAPQKKSVFNNKLPDSKPTVFLLLLSLGFNFSCTLNLVGSGGELQKMVTCLKSKNSVPRVRHVKLKGYVLKKRQQYGRTT